MRVAIPEVIGVEAGPQAPSEGHTRWARIPIVRSDPEESRPPCKTVEGMHNSGFRRISASMGFYKVVLPVFCIVLLVFVLFATSSSERVWQSLLVVGVTGAAGAFVFRTLIWDLADEVLDAGDHLVFRKGGETQRVRFEDIIRVDHQYLSAPERVTVEVRSPGPLGTEVVFCLPTRLNPFPKSPIVADLVRRVEEARRAESDGGPRG